MMINLWLATAGMQAVIAVTYFSSGNISAGLGGVFGAWMCLIHWAHLKGLY